MALGIAAAVLAAACYECGYVLQALEARRAPAELALHASLLIRLAGRRRWLAGTALSLAGAGLQVLALAHAPVTVVQPVLALGIVGLLVLARLWLGERVSGAGAAGAAALIAGVVAVGIAGPERSDHVQSVAVLAALLAPIGAVAVLPFALRDRAGGGLMVAAAAGGDALAAVALKLTANALSNGAAALALLAVAGAGVAGFLALTAEMSALRELPATRVAPVVLGAQVIVPAVVAMTALGEPASGVLAVGIAAAGAGAALLGSSAGVAGLRAGGLAADAEALADHARRGGERAEPLPR